MEQFYPWIKMLHMICAAITITGFSARVFLSLIDSPVLNQRWIKIAPHINDTVLLACAIYLALILQQYPFTHPWLTAKVLGLLVYIASGFMALKFARTKSKAITLLLISWISFAYIVGVALTRTPTLGVEL